jgi:hypothetical protein
MRGPVSEGMQYAPKLLLEAQEIKETGDEKD